MSRFGQSYSSWEGDKTGSGDRMKFFIKAGFKRTMRSKWTIAILLISYALLVMPRLFEALALPDAFVPLFYFSFFKDIQMFLLLLVAVVGAGIISDDMKDFSIVLYFTKGIGRKGYVIGRVVTIMLALSMLTIVAFVAIFAVALISVEISFSTLQHGAWVFAAGMAMGLFLAVFMTLLVSALSTLLRDRKYTGACIFFLVIFSELAASILESLSTNQYIRLISIWDNIDVVGTYFFRLGSMHSFPQWYSGGVLFFIMSICAFILYYSLVRREVRI
ncbi:MAG: ABC-2 transporter permease [Candidatus Methanofastidiosia archaeon]